MKRYLQCTIETNNGQIIDNPLKLSEVHLITQIVKENKKVIVELKEMNPTRYKLVFG